MNIPFGLSPLRAYIYAGVAVLFMVVLVFAGCQHQRAENEMVLRISAESQRDQAIEENKTNMVTIATQTSALNEWAKVGVSPQDVVEIVKAATEFAKALADQRAENAKLKEKDRAIPECDALLRTDFGKLCPRRGRILRQYESRYSHGDGESPDSGVRGPAGEPHEHLPAEVSLPGG